jgi:hypothetical protein
LRPQVVERHVVHLKAEPPDHLHHHLRIVLLPRDQLNTRLGRLYTCFEQQGLGLLEIGFCVPIGIMLRLVEVDVAWRDHLVGDDACPARREAHEGGLVDGVGDRLSDAQVVERRPRASVVEGHEEPAGILERR